MVQFKTSQNRCRRCLTAFEVELPPPPIQEPETHPNIAAGVRGWRRLRGLTQKQLASAAHLPRTYISRIENGRILPGLGTLERVAGALQVGLAALLDRHVPRRLAAPNGLSDNGSGNGNGHSLNGNGNGSYRGSPLGFGFQRAQETEESEEFLQKMARYARMLTVGQRARVMERIRQLVSGRN
jgi:transcriptional regulator with XRE-family HTH domain